MSELLEEFLQATDWPTMMNLARDLSVKDYPADVPGLQKALGDPLESKRYAAVYALGFSRRDKRAVSPLIRVLENKDEAPRVRAQAAECLGMLGKRKAIRALIRCSIDDSAEVRFWCVFAMGQYWWRRRGRKQPLSIVRALEARLGDRESPDNRGNYWAVGLEALAMLRSRPARHATSKLFRTTMLSVLNDPLSHPDKWQWAACYWDTADGCGGSESRALFDAAVRRIHDAGSDPVTFGRDRPSGTD